MRNRSDAPMSITARRVVTEPRERGEFKYFVHPSNPEVIAGMAYVCPCGCGGKGTIRFDTVHDNGWAWDGNVEKPTLSPSVKQVTCGWHGWLRNGRWDSV